MGRLTLTIGVCYVLVAALVICIIGAGMLAVGIALFLCIPFVITVGVTICLALYLILRLFEFVGSDDSYSELFNIGNCLCGLVVLGSLINILVGWEIWIAIVSRLHVITHKVVLGMEVIKLVKLFRIHSGLCIVMMIPRCLLVYIRWEEFDIKRDIGDSIVGAFECVLFMLAELDIIKYIPNWKYHVALGTFQTWKLIQVLVLILFGIMVINVTTRLIVDVLQLTCKDSKHVVYFAEGLRKTTNFVLISTMLMATWFSYFDPHFRQTAGSVVGSSRALELVSWTFVCVAIASMLWLIKKFFVLLWEAHAVYKRFENKIMQASRQLIYFLDILGNTSIKDILVQQQKSRHSTSTIYDLQRMTKYFQDIDPDSLQEKYENIAKTFEIENSKKIISGLDGSRMAFISNYYRTEAKGISTDNFEISVIKAYRNCRELGNTIVGAQEVASYLNSLLTGFFLSVIIIIWLLVTKIATVQILLFVISPLLAASFVIGDSCKTIFQGLVFAFVLHLFDVGDICAINGTKMEVRRIGIWKTIFRNVDTNEEVMYQNSILANTVIIKQKGSLDLNDSVEYCMSTVTWNRPTFLKLKTMIDGFIEKSSNHNKHPLGVLVKEVGEKVKIVIHFKHKPGDQDMIYSEYYKKQNRNRAEVLMKVKEILDP